MSETHKKVAIHLYTQSNPVEITGVRNTYQKGDLFCVMLVETPRVYKFPLQHIFRIVEDG